MYVPWNRDLAGGRGHGFEMNTSFFGELLQSISERGRSLIERGRGRYDDAAQRSETLIELCEELLSGRGEASGVALAREILARYADVTTGPRIAFFEALATRFGPDNARLDAAVEAWRAKPSDATAAELHAAAEPRRQELLRRLNLAPGGTKALVAMREQLLSALEHRDDLAAVDADFVHLFTAWFNRGFLVLRRIDWATPAIVLEKIIRYEAVHEIDDWDDLRRRIDPRGGLDDGVVVPTLLLPVTAALPVHEIDAAEPLRPLHAIQPGDHHARRKTMARGQGRPVEVVGDHDRR